MTTGVRLKLADTYDELPLNNIWHPLNMFLDDWLQDVCKDSYVIYNRPVESFNVGYHIKFDSEEDALIVKLTDLPPEIAKYISIHDLMPLQ